MIGKAATQLKQITDTTGAGVQLLQSAQGDGFSSVKITGNAKQVEDALELLLFRLRSLRRVWHCSMQIRKSVS